MYQWFMILIHLKCIIDTDTDIVILYQKCIMILDTWYFFSIKIRIMIHVSLILPNTAIYRGTHRVGNSAVSPRLVASQSPSKIWRAAAAGKIATRRLISRIILESVVNASSRRRRGVPTALLGFCHGWTLTQHWFTKFANTFEQKQHIMHAFIIVITLTV